MGWYNILLSPSKTRLCSWGEGPRSSLAFILSDYVRLPFCSLSFHHLVDYAHCRTRLPISFPIDHRHSLALQRICHMGNVEILRMYRKISFLVRAAEGYPHWGSRDHGGHSGSIRHFQLLLVLECRVQSSQRCVCRVGCFRPKKREG